MRNIIILVFVLILVSFSCKKENEAVNNIDYSKFVTIKQGLWGSIKFKEGNWFPGDITGTEYPVKRGIYIYQLTNENQAIPIGGQSYNFYSKITSPLEAYTESDQNGFYQIALKPGTYSILISELEQYYCCVWDGKGNLCPVKIISNSTTERNLTIGYKSYSK